ncbi:MAG TPA: tetratricopeptide repeat protein [Verrucomicrobiae bacterium]|jgi:tetratricopeptide (TPR) repeat protein|nr:tetratricopeptide repeat protein [Verrucomicrobiae bacterium]
MTESGSRRTKWLVCALLGVAVLIVYGPALHCGFVNFDDENYVIDNWHIQHGFNLQSVRWAFTTDAASNWHPLTWLSHTLDCQLYGLHPAGHHLTSLLLHAANSVLLLLLLNRVTGALWRSAVVAAMFAIHPLRVESVVWISERKDVLSAFFWMLTVGAYVRYAEEFKVQGSKFKVFYGLSLLFFALGLMAKPMLVTLPFVLLLLDYWPLRRLEFGPGFSWRPVVEKIPFLVLAVASSVVTFLVQYRTGAVATLSRFSLSVRLENIPVSYMRYLTKTFWPSDLASFYPYAGWPVGEVIGAVALLAGITGLALWRARSAPYLAVGWFWFLGMLVPAIGLVQVGGQSLADRYSYLPCIGLWIMVSWGVFDLASRRPRLREAMTTAAALVVIVFALLAWRQTGVYQDSGTLWQATLRSYPNCLMAHNLLSRWYIEKGEWDQALEQCQEARAILPHDPTVHDDLSRILLHQGKVDDAIAEALQSIQAQPQSEDNRQTLARAYLEKGDFAAAAASCREAIRIQPAAPEAWCNLGFALLQQGQIAEATAAYQRALELNPDAALAHNDLGNIFLRQRRTDEAMAQFQRAVELNPSFAEAHYNLAGLLAYRGRLDEAIAHCQKALEIQPSLAAARERLTSLMATKERNSGH